MLVEIDKIVVKDRIRKDFGDIEKLAQSIKKNSLYNPITVMSLSDGTFQLIAGERRLRACKSLGMTNITVNTISVQDAENALMVEIDENENRKEFSKEERIDYAMRLERIEAVKAKERMSDGGKGSQISDNLRTDDVVANKLGIGSRDTYRKEKSIVANKDLLDPEDFADWDEGKLSTNKAYQKIKAKLKEQEEEIKQLKEQNQHYSTLSPELQKALDGEELTAGDVAKLMKQTMTTPELYKLQEAISKGKKYTQEQVNDMILHWKNRYELAEADRKEIAQRKEKIIYVETDKPETLEKIEELKEKNRVLAKDNIEQAKMLNQAIGSSTNYQLTSHCSEITLKMLNFVSEMAKYDYMAESFNEIPIATRIEYKKCVNSVKKWADRIIETINTEENYVDADVVALDNNDVVVD